MSAITHKAHYLTNKRSSKSGSAINLLFRQHSFQSLALFPTFDRATLTLVVQRGGKESDIARLQISSTGFSGSEAVASIKEPHLFKEEQIVSTCAIKVFSSFYTVLLHVSACGLAFLYSTLSHFWMFWYICYSEKLLLTWSPGGSSLKKENKVLVSFVGLFQEMSDIAVTQSGRQKSRGAKNVREILAEFLLSGLPSSW